MSQEEPTTTWGTMTAHIYVRVGDTKLTEVGTAEIPVGPHIQTDVVLADMFEGAAASLRKARAEQEQADG